MTKAIQGSIDPAAQILGHRGSYCRRCMRELVPTKDGKEMRSPTVVINLFVCCHLKN